MDKQLLHRQMRIITGNVPMETPSHPAGKIIARFEDWELYGIQWGGERFQMKLIRTTPGKMKLNYWLWWNPVAEQILRRRDLKILSKQNPLVHDWLLKYFDSGRWHEDIDDKKFRNTDDGRSRLSKEEMAKKALDGQKFVKKKWPGRINGVN